MIDQLPGGPRSVTEFNYRISDHDRAHVFVGLSTTPTRARSTRIVKHFQGHGFAALDLTHDDMAKEHLRHMVGGAFAPGAG